MNMEAASLREPEQELPSVASGGRYERSPGDYLHSIQTPFMYAPYLISLQALTISRVLVHFIGASGAPDPPSGLTRARSIPFRPLIAHLIAVEGRRWRAAPKARLRPEQF